MIFISGRDNAMGSKRFTDAVANTIRPHLKDFLDEEQFDDFELGLYQTRIHFGYWNQAQFMSIFRLIKSKQMVEFEEERLLLLELMQQDPRFQA